MSWKIGDDEWLVEPRAAPATGPLDAFDERMLHALGYPAGGSSQAAEPAPMPTADPTHVAESFALTSDDLPPPPYSAAFDADDDPPSYESGRFVSEPDPADGQAAISGEFYTPSSAREPEAEEEPDFHIPMLSFGAAASVVAAEPTVLDAPVSDPEPDEHVEHEPAEPSSYVIPGLVEPPRRELDIVLEHADGRVDSSADVAPRPVDPPPGADFVIPPLAFVAPEPAFQQPAPIEHEPNTAREPDAPEPTHAPAVAEEEIDDLEDLEEDDLEEDDLEEVDQVSVSSVLLEAMDARPPAPPELRPQQPKQRRKAWYDDVFAEHFLFLYPLSWEATSQRDAQFIHVLLGERAGQSVLDVGCGDGRHAVELAKLGARVTGLDSSLPLLLAAAQTKDATPEIDQAQVEFIHGDMRRLPRDREFDAVICVGTTLGYFEEDQNWVCLQEMHDRLLPGGRLLIHVFNRDFVAPHLPSRSWWQGKRCMVIDEAEMNFFANRLRVHRTVIFDDGRQYEHYMFMRAYTVQDLGKAISQLGMRVLEVSGSRDTRGRFYGSASPDIWIVAEKPIK